MLSSDPYRPDVVRLTPFQIMKGEGGGLEYFDRQLSKRADPSAIVDFEGHFACLRFDLWPYTDDLPDLVCWASKGPPSVFLLGSRRNLEEGVIGDEEEVVNASTYTPDVVDVIGRLVGRHRWHRPYLDHFRTILQRVEAAGVGARYAIDRVESGFVRRKIRAVVRQLAVGSGNYEWRPNDPHVLVGSPVLVTRQADEVSVSKRDDLFT